jgi:hypothetical protein
MNFDSVRKIALEFADVEDSTIYGSPALKVSGKLMACIPVNKSAEPGSVAVQIDFERRSELLAADPKTYYVTDHYENHPIVLVRLTKISHDDLEELLGMSWHFVRRRPPSRNA